MFISDALSRLVPEEIGDISEVIPLSFMQHLSDPYIHHAYLHYAPAQYYVHDNGELPTLTPIRPRAWTRKEIALNLPKQLDDQVADFMFQNVVVSEKAQDWPPETLLLPFLEPPMQLQETELGNVDTELELVTAIREPPK